MLTLEVFLIIAAFTAFQMMNFLMVLFLSTDQAQIMQGHSPVWHDDCSFFVILELRTWDVYSTLVKHSYVLLDLPSPLSINRLKV